MSYEAPRPIDERALEGAKESRPGKRPRLVTPLFLLVMASTFAYFLAVGALIPVLPLYVEGPLGYDEFQVGLVVGVFSITAVILRPIAGRLGDERGRRILLIGGGLIVGVSVLGYTLVSSLAPLIFFRLLTGVGEAFFYTGAASVINDLAPEERRGEAISYFSLALFLGIGLGPVVGELVLEQFSFDAVWVVAAVAALAAGVIGIPLPDTRPEGAAEASAAGPRRFIHRAALLPGTVLAANIWGLATFTSFVPLYALEIGMKGSRFIFVLHAVIAFLIRAFGARIPDKLGPGRSGRAALTLVAAGMLVIGLWSEPAGLLLGTAIYSIGHSLAFPAMMTLAIRGAPASERGAVVGTFTAFFDLSFGVGALSAGLIAAVLGYRGAFIFASGIAGAGLMLLYARAKRIRRLREESPEPAPA